MIFIIFVGIYNVIRIGGIIVSVFIRKILDIDFIFVVF